MAALAAFAAMGLVTFSMRAGGYWLMGRLPMTDRLRRGLQALPGALIVATIVPVALQKGIPASICMLVTALAMAIVRRDLVAVIAGLAAAALLRHFGF
ncbi:AzlD domain-containing protein [Breoghania sp. L-A4]|nr:AzlD domain-containing protein [Breoghania sp. L-A4]